MDTGTVVPLPSVGIDLWTGGGGQLPKCVKFCPGIEVYGRFSLKNERLYRHELGDSTPQPLDNSNPASTHIILQCICRPYVSTRGRIKRRTPSVRPSVRISVCLSHF